MTDESDIDVIVERLTAPKSVDLSRIDANSPRIDASLAVDAAALRQLKQFAKSSNANVKRVVDLLWIRLDAKQTASRIASLAAIDQLVARSAYARKLVVSALSDFVALTIGGNSSRPIPGSSSARVLLQHVALGALERWHAEHAALYPQLTVTMAFVRDTLRLEFPSVVAARHADAAREKAAQIQRRLHAKFAQLAPIAEAKLPEIESVVEQIEAGLALLVPFDDDDRHDDANADTRQAAEPLQLGDLGMPSREFAIDVVVDTREPVVQESDDNAALFATLRENAAVLQRWLAVDAMAWEVTLTKIDPNSRAIATRRNKLLFELIDVKSAARAALNSCTEMGVSLSDNADDGDDDEWEDAPKKDGFEEYAAEAPADSQVLARPPDSPRELAAAAAAAEAATEEKNSEATTKRHKTTDDAAEDEPPTYVPHWAQRNAQPGELRRNETREQLRARAPVVMPQPMLTNWGTNAAATALASVNRQHRFFGEGDDGDVNVSADALQRADPSLTMYATYTDGTTHFSAKRKQAQARVTGGTTKAATSKSNRE
jgi:hypothetical protein